MSRRHFSRFVCGLTSGLCKTLLANAHVTNIDAAATVRQIAFFSNKIKANQQIIDLQGDRMFARDWRHCRASIATRCRRCSPGARSAARAVAAGDDNGGVGHAPEFDRTYFGFGWPLRSGRSPMRMGSSARSAKSSAVKAVAEVAHWTCRGDRPRLAARHSRSFSPRTTAMSPLASGASGRLP